MSGFPAYVTCWLHHVGLGLDLGETEEARALPLCLRQFSGFILVVCPQSENVNSGGPLSCSHVHFAEVQMSCMVSVTWKSFVDCREPCKEKLILAQTVIFM